jgi:hypothetical protein
MRKVAVLLVGFTLLALLILLPVTRSVNHILGNPVGNSILHNGSIQADGTPGPPFPPKKPRAAAPVIVADGTPGPPFPPKKPRSTPITISRSA